MNLQCVSGCIWLCSLLHMSFPYSYVSLGLWLNLYLKLNSLWTSSAAISGGARRKQRKKVILCTLLKSIKLEFRMVQIKICWDWVRLCNCWTFPQARFLKIVSAGFVPIHTPITLKLWPKSWRVYCSSLDMKFYSDLILFRVLVSMAERKRAVTEQFHPNWKISISHTDNFYLFF